MSRAALRCWVSGRVQGVFFRASTRDQARRLGLTGYARNLPDGRVEVVAVGEPAALERLRDWLWQGPPAARVEDVRCEPVEPRPFADFTTA
ncbi:acylphosphatase [Thiohalobacter sp. IOR34]|uniref:acylphosphatase n=1 Tax=Thiohalobacter sp. IOR34 TaxID=3057176 RepID=UPI0025AFDB94|nr:acylphosphatase [Thiohalobacter sp. IOR34]WJW76130.1 acylphosphatase [Thiohalobacter sp. IOR34]